MTLQASGTIDASDINTELGRSSDAPFRLGGSSERALASVSSGAISLSDFYSKTTAAAEEVTFLGSSITYSGTSSLTFSSVPFGTAGASRRIIVCVYGKAGATGLALSSVTIGGVAATIHVNNAVDDGVSMSLVAAIVSASVTSGTSGSVVPTFNKTVNDAGIGTFTAPTGATISDTVTGQDSGVGALSAGGTITRVSGGTLIACVSGSVGAASTPLSFSNVSEVYDRRGLGEADFSTRGRMAGGLGTNTASGNVSVSVSGVGETSGSAYLILAAASFSH